MSNATISYCHLNQKFGLKTIMFNSYTNYIIDKIYAKITKFNKNIIILVHILYEDIKIHMLLYLGMTQTAYIFQIYGKTTLI